MPRAIWSGSISFGLVTIPIKVYPAIKQKEIKFNLVDKEGHPIKYKYWCEEENREVPKDEVRKAFKISKDKYIIIEKNDLEKLKLKTTKTIEIIEFIDISQIDPIFYETAYYLAPSQGGEKAYFLFAEALRLSNKAAIAKVVMRNKEYLVAIRAYKKGLVMHILHYIDEIRDIEEIPELKTLIPLKEEELKLAQALIEKLTEKEVDLSKFKDTYTEALKKLIKAKIEGKEFKIEEEKPAEEAKSLMKALEESIEIAKKKKKAEAKA
ncbi:MAG: Ku protein [Candidatus Aenigmarchaeota archaeon ex4484_224]|nr:MAG: Ku protein [Candidatus Aenigmarchaeota archaeon ex4484_224]